MPTLFFIFNIIGGIFMFIDLAIKKKPKRRAVEPCKIISKNGTVSMRSCFKNGKMKKQIKVI